MSGWFRRVATELIDGLTTRNRQVTWEKPHGKGTAGRNKFGAAFWLYDMAPAYPPEKRWHLSATPLCPDGRNYCSQHDEDIYHGPDRDEAKRAAQQWSNRRWPLLVENERS